MQILARAERRTADLDRRCDLHSIQLGAVEGPVADADGLCILSLVGDGIAIVGLERVIDLLLNATVELNDQVALVVVDRTAPIAFHRGRFSALDAQQL